jgi:hypothetical protein
MNKAADAVRKRDPGERTMGVTSSVSTSVEKNFGSRTSHPPRPEATGVRRQDDGDGVNCTRSRRRKKYGCRTYPSAPDRRASSAKDCS